MRKRLMVMASLLLVLGVGFTSSCSSVSNSDSDKEDNKSSINISSGEITISGVATCEVGSTSKLTATVKNDPTREGVSWSSSNTGVASVDDDGLVSGVSEGSVTITATLIGDTSVKSSITFSVTASSEPSVSIDASVVSAKVGSSITLSANVYNPKNKDLTYLWSNTTGVVMVSGEKTSTCTLTSSRGGEDTITLKVTIGQTVYQDSISVYFFSDYSGYTEIATKEDFKSNFLKSGEIEGNYYLSADIDLSGEVINGGSLSNSFKGVLDGRGHSVTGYEIQGVLGSDTNALYANTGLFKQVYGTIKNTHFSGKTNEKGVGWGSSVLANELYGTIENCLVEYENAFNQGKDGWFPFTGAICGVLKDGATPKITNCVVNVTGEGQGAAMAICAYAANKNSTSYTVDGVYTNQSSAATFGSDWDYGYSITTAKNCETSIDWTSSKASIYSTLNSVLWKLEDNKMPTLNVL